MTTAESPAGVPGREPQARSGRGPRQGARVPPRPVLRSASHRRRLGVLPELTDETVVTAEVDVGALHELIAQLLLQAYRARGA